MMIDLEATQPVAQVHHFRPRSGVTILGSRYEHARDYPPTVAHLDTHRRGIRSPLFKAALDLLAGVDRSAVLMVLADAYPRSTLSELDQAMREMSVLFLAAGLRPKEGA